MKGIILHGGHGTRLRPLTHTGPKQLLKIANKPMSQYVLEDLREMGVTDIGVIIGGSYSEKVKEYYGNGEKFGVKLTYIYQDEPKGIAHAIGLCKNFVGQDKFVVYLGDNILRSGLLQYSEKFAKIKSEALILLCEVDNPSKFGVAEIKNEKIIKIVEKPKVPPSKFAVIGIYFLMPSIFPIIEKLKPSWRGELEITEALQLMMDNGFNIDYDFVTGWWKDTGTPEDILEANRLILETMERKKLTKINPTIIIGDGTKVEDGATLLEPIIIGNDCMIEKSVRIGPNVSVGNNTVLKNCQIENSIVMDNCRIESKIQIVDSIIADHTQITQNNQKKYVFLLGERSQLKL